MLRSSCARYRCLTILPALLTCSTFDRLVDGSRHIMVRFDKEYSYGDEHDAWKDFAKTVGESSADVLICDVGVSGQRSAPRASPRTSLSLAAISMSTLIPLPTTSEYGDKDNSDLSDRFSIKSDDFPAYRFWAKGSSSSADPVVYSSAKKKDDFLRFIQEKAGAWIGLAGQVKEMDMLAKEFLK
jgi:endoplasmic reticulum protein 29